jgi:hypothetical protein
LRQGDYKDTARVRNFRKLDAEMKSQTASRQPGPSTNGADRFPSSRLSFPDKICIQGDTRFVRYRSEILRLGETNESITPTPISTKFSPDTESRPFQRHIKLALEYFPQVINSGICVQHDSSQIPHRRTICSMITTKVTFF